MAEADLIIKTGTWGVCFQALINESIRVYEMDPIKSHKVVFDFTYTFLPWVYLSVRTRNSSY